LQALVSYGRFIEHSLSQRIMEEVVRFLEEIELKQKKPFNIFSLIQASVANIICSLAFGQRFDYKDKKFVRLLEMLNETFRLLQPNSLVSAFPYLRHFPGDPGNGKLMIKHYDLIRVFLQEMIDEHKQKFDEQNIGDYIDAYLTEMQHERNTFTGICINNVYLYCNFHH